jgi:uncharacterized protein (UPF0248 family)
VQKVLGSGGLSSKFHPTGRHPRHILNEIKWRGLDMERCEIDILHRGAPQNTITASASEIELGRSFFKYKGTEIPYHRILRIRFEGREIFRRQSGSF